MSQSVDLDNLFTRELEKNDGSVLCINQSAVGDVGCVVWDAAISLTLYLETPDFQETPGSNKLRGKNVLELGAGTGIVGIQAACLGANSIITDLEDFVPLMALNIRVNQALITGSATARELRWGTDVTDYQPPDYILIADCVYYEEAVGPLVQTITDLCDDHTVVICSYEERTTGNKPELQKKFFELVEKVFRVEEIPLERHDPVYRSEDIHIMKFIMK
ncbi:protein-lysine methyltransferase METTL21D-like [Lingula anatina]|uniref:Protein-lysine methyltransferase METTL21D-like n=1 Tax=Lingula anatina TaxID=7574 RepID=A0A1S3HCY8_LINAN|nr:protein-lysine methyltransferase METTL21D-like [Lingula anatina]|eukprot:XP_013383912.1 protein-lysine methyltransferase METTL21D-like [Lingula anatina]